MDNLEKIVICGSISAYMEIEKVSNDLIGLGYEVKIPLSVERILKKELTIEKFTQELEEGEGHKRKIQDDVIRAYYEKIKDADAILVCNFDKNGVANYIGGNTFLEIGFAHVLNKKIFLLNPIPKGVSYVDEIRAMQPVVLDEDLGKIK